MGAAPPSYTMECKGLHNETIHCVHAINFFAPRMSQQMAFVTRLQPCIIEQRCNRCWRGTQDSGVWIGAHLKRVRETLAWHRHVSDFIYFLLHPWICVKEKQ